jgi:hypothetical protein
MARLAQIVIKRWGQETPTPAPILGAEERDELRVGIAGHAFDHLGAIGDQAAAAAASGMTIIYPACFGQIGYDGLPGPEEIEFLRKKFSAYLHDAKASGIKLALAYVCSTSIVRLETFDKNWSKEFRAQFVTPTGPMAATGSRRQTATLMVRGQLSPGMHEQPRLADL